jgi:starch phosphorylase
VNDRWSSVSFVDAAAGPDSKVLSGAPLPLRASLHLAGLKPEDVRVEAVIGRVGVGGELEHTEVLTLAPLEEHEGVFLFGKDFAPNLTGRLGYSVRVSPNHYDDPLNRPCNAPLKWANGSE